MSSYYEDDRRRTSTRDRRRDTDYYDDDVYNNTRDNQRSTTTALVRRRNDSPDSVEEVRRDFSPGGGGYYRETITRKSGVRPAGRARSYDNDRSYDDDRSFASTRRDSYKRDSRYEDDRRSGRGGRRNNYSSSSSRSSTPPKKRERRKSMPEEAMEALGLGGVVAALTGKKNRDRSSSSERSRGGGRRGSRSKSHGREQLIQAFKSAALAGAGAAFAARHEEGGWQGGKGKRVLTAALTAGGANGLLNQYKDPEKHKLRDTLGSAAAGLAADRLVNGPASRPGSPNGRGGRNQSRSRVGDLAAGGAIAAAAKKLTDGFRSRSQSRGRNSRSPSYDSYADGSPDRRRSRSKRGSIARSLSRVGLTGVANKVDPAGAGARERSRSRGPSRRSRSRYSSDDDSYYDDRRRADSMYDDGRRSYQPPQSGVYGDNREVGPQSSRPRSLSRARSIASGDGQMVPRPSSVGSGARRIRTPPPGYTYTNEPQHTGDPETDSSNDLGSSSDDEQEHKKGRKSMLIAGGLATVATIHAGKSIHDTMEKRMARKKAVEEGKMSKEDAKKHKTKDRLQDLASVGLAGLGVKGAYGEWKEMKEKQEEWHETKEKGLRHRRKRAARRMKARLAGVHGEYSSSAPTLSDPFYGNNGYDAHGQQQLYHGGQGPYMSGARHGDDPNQPQYYDGNPYAYAAGNDSGYQDQGHGYGQGQGEGYPDGNHVNHVNHNGYDNNTSNMHFPPPPPAQGGTGYPPPPMGGPSPLSGGR